MLRDMPFIFDYRPRARCYAAAISCPERYASPAYRLYPATVIAGGFTPAPAIVMQPNSAARITAQPRVAQHSGFVSSVAPMPASQRNLHARMRYRYAVENIVDIPPLSQTALRVDAAHACSVAPPLPSRRRQAHAKTMAAPSRRSKEIQAVAAGV